MAFDLSETRTEVCIYEERSGTTQSLFARDPTPQERIGYMNESVFQDGGVVVNKVAQTRLKFGCSVLEEAQAAAKPEDSGYGFFNEKGEWVPLTSEVEKIPVRHKDVVKEYTELYGQAWCEWIGKLPLWKLFLLAKAPSHIDRMADVIFEGAARYRQPQRKGATEGN